MAHMNIFEDDAFSCVEMSGALDRVPYVPGFLGSLGIFESTGIRTTAATIEKREGRLALVPTTPRGAPLPQGGPRARDMRVFQTVRVAKGDRINASELQNIREFGTESELQQVATEVAGRMATLRGDLDLTHENMRMGAVQGILLDSDGSTIYNYFTEFGIAQPAEIDFDLDAAAPAAGVLIKKCKAVQRTMLKAAKGLWVPGRSRIVALCGDAFWDDLIAHKDVEKTFLNWQAAADLRKADVYDTFPFGNIEWVNYRSTDDATMVGVPTDSCKFVPVGVPGAFRRFNGPGETFDLVNQPGKDFFAMVVPDKDRNMYADVEVYSYPLYMCATPELLLRGKRT
jgi:hypothetical protein